jgi:hypothetical protein
MKTKLQDEIGSTSRISRFAKRSFQVYQEHYKSRNLKPTMTLDEFMKNYRTQ